MSPQLIGGVGITLMLALMFLGVPVGVAIGLIGLAGTALIMGSAPAFSLVGLLTPPVLQDYTIALLPLFLLMGEFADISGLMKEAYRASNKWLGNLPGGLAMASVVGAAGFSAVSGSSMACAAVMTRVALPHLLEYKYSPKLAVGALAAGGTLGNLVPPGIMFVFYAVMAETSIGQLYIAAIIPGILLTLMYVFQIYIQCKIDPALGPRTGATSWKEKLLAIKDALALIVVFALVMGGIWFGVFTPSEAAAAGTLFVFVYALFRKTLSGQNITTAFKNTLITTGMAFFVLVGARIFTSFIALSGLPQALSSWVIHLEVAPVVVVIVIMVLYLILGTAMDVLSMLLLTVPIFVVVLRALGIDLVWFGVLVITQMELANLSPPAGLNLYVVATMVKDRGITMDTVFKGVWPFCGTMVIFNVLIVAFPQLSLFLVNFMRQ